MTETRFPFDDDIDRALERMAGTVRPPAPSVDIAAAVRARIEHDQLTAVARRRRHRHRPRQVLAVAASLAVLAAGAAGAAGVAERSRPSRAAATRVAAPVAPAGPSPVAAPGPGAGTGSGHTTLAAIRDRLGFTVMVPADLGVPDAVIDQSRPGEPRVVLVYRPDEGSSGSAVQVVETAGADDYRNVADAALVRHDGFTGFWYQAPRAGTVAADGNGWLSGHPLPRWNTLLWQHAGVTMRIDSRLPLAAAIAVASSMTPAQLERSLRNLS